MKQQHAGAQVVPYPRYQRFAAAAAQTKRHQQLIHGLLEVDVTGARVTLRAHKAETGESLSFTAFLAGCVARAVDDDRAVQAFHYGGKRLVLFDDVDISTRVEREVDGHQYVVPYIIRAANRKSVRELHDEIRAAQTTDVRPRLTRFAFMPIGLYRPFAAATVAMGWRRPWLWKALMGTVGLTAVGMFGNGAGWGIPAASPTPLMVTVGGIGARHEVVDGVTVAKEYLSLTISVDHDIVDGAPAARFTQRVKDLVESSYGLREATFRPDGAPAAPEPELGATLATRA